MTSQIFADGISRIRVVNGTVRIDFVSSGEDAGGAPLVEPQIRVVMPVKGFVEAHRAMQQVMAALSGNGTIVATPAADAHAVPPPRPAARKRPN